MNQALAAQWAFVALREANLAILNSRPNSIPHWAITAKPYLKAVAYNDYGYEDPVMCVLYALNNMTSWRGATARKVKLELNEAIK